MDLYKSFTSIFWNKWRYQTEPNIEEAIVTFKKMQRETADETLKK